MRTAKSRAIIRHISVLSLLILLSLAAPRCWHWTKAESATTTEGLPSLRGEEAITHLKERGLYASLGEAVKAARNNAQPLPPDVAPLLSGSLRLEAADGAAEDYFGAAVAISGDTVVVGTGGSQDSVYFFERSGETWTERQKLTASDGATFDSFASTIAISGDTVVVGAPYADVGANAEQGAAYVFAGVACPAITLDPPSLPNGTAGNPYNWSVTATGSSGIYNYSVSSGTLPVGLTLNPATGSLSGRPTMAGSYDFTITATDGSLCPGSHDYTLVIDCPIISVSPANPNLPPGQVGAFYNRGFTANGGLAPYSFSLSAGALPAGLSLDSTTGVLSGAPTVSGTFNFAIQANDSGGCSGRTAYVLTISCPTIQINPANPNLPNGTAGAPFNGAFTVMGEPLRTVSASPTALCPAD